MIQYNNRYFATFNLLYDPFLKNNADKCIFESSDFRELNFCLNRLLDIKGFALITGDPGLGKTTALRMFAHNLNKNLYKVIYIPITSLTNMDLIYLLVKELGLVPTNRKSTNIKTIQKAILDFASRGITPFIIFDEANYLSSSFLNDLKMIFNFKMDSYNNFVVILAGLPFILSTLSSILHEPLRQRIGINYSFQGLSKSEAESYIRNKLSSAGGSENIFDEGALNYIVDSAKGKPRVIDLIMTNALLVASMNQTHLITKKVADDAIQLCSI